MYREPKLLQKLFGEKFGYGCDIGSSAFVALEWGLVRSIEDEDGMNRERDQAKEAVVKGAQGRIRAACSPLATTGHVHGARVSPLLACT